MTELLNRERSKEKECLFSFRSNTREKELSFLSSKLDTCRLSASIQFWGNDESDLLLLKIQQTHLTLISAAYLHLFIMPVNKTAVFGVITFWIRVIQHPRVLDLVKDVCTFSFFFFFFLFFYLELLI